MIVRPSSKAERQIREQYRWLRENRTAGHAAAWFRSLQAAKRAILPMPESRPICRESDDLPGGPYREHYFGAGRSKTHRLVFRVTPAAVEVVAVRGLRQRDLTAGDV